MAKERSFRYKPPSKETLSERANMRGGNFDSIIKQEYKTYKVKDGKNVIRIMPCTWQEGGYYGYDIFVNYNIGADNQSYLSLSKMKNHKDPLAEARVIAERDGDDELGKQLRPTQRILMWVIDRNAPDDGPQLWAAPFTVAKAFVNLARDEDTGKVLYIDDPEEGNDVRFYKEGSQLTTKYDASKMKLMGASPLSDDDKEQQAWLDYIQEHPIPGCLNFYDYKHIASVFNGAPAKEEAAEKGNGTERVRSRARPAETEDDPPSRRRALSPDSDEGDEDPPPRRRVVRDEPEGGEAELVKGSIRDRIKRRREEAEAADDD